MKEISIVQKLYDLLNILYVRVNVLYGDIFDSVGMAYGQKLPRMGSEETQGAEGFILKGES